MAQFDDDWLAHQRKRWMRPDAYRWVRPDAYRFMPPGAPRYDGKDAVKYFWPEAETGDFARHDDAEAAVLQRELDDIRRDFEALRREWLARKAGFNPSQPRVQAGNPGGGQWTSGGGASSVGLNDPRVLSDATPDNFFEPGTQLAQNETQRRYSVDLGEEEIRGGHTLSEHVGKTDGELLASVRGDRGQGGIYRYARQRLGSFESNEAANNFVNRTLEQNKSAVDLVARGNVTRDFVKSRFGYTTGREAFRPSLDADPYMRSTYGVGVEIRHDPRVERGYRVHTAYPRND